MNIPDGIYGLEKVDWNTGKTLDGKTDRSADMTKINQVLFDKANKKISDTSKLFNSKTAKITYNEVNPADLIPTGATISMLTNSGTDITGMAGKVEVSFIMLQNVEAGALQTGPGTPEGTTIKADDDDPNKAILTMTSTAVTIVDNNLTNDQLNKNWFKSEPAGMFDIAITKEHAISITASDAFKTAGKGDIKLDIANSVGKKIFKEFTINVVYKAPASLK